MILGDYRPRHSKQLQINLKQVTFNWRGVIRNVRHFIILFNIYYFRVYDQFSGIYPYQRESRPAYDVTSLLHKLKKDIRS